MVALTRQLNPNGQECQALAQKIDNIVNDISKRQNDITTNPLGLPQSAPGPLRGSVGGHQILLQQQIQALANAANDYNQKCGGGQPTGGSGSSSMVPSATGGLSIPKWIAPVAIGAGIVGTAIICPECLLVEAPFVF